MIQGLAPGVKLRPGYVDGWNDVSDCEAEGPVHVNSSGIRWAPFVTIGHDEDDDGLYAVSGWVVPITRNESLRNLLIEDSGIDDPQPKELYLDLFVYDGLAVKILEGQSENLDEIKGYFADVPTLFGFIMDATGGQEIFHRAWADRSPTDESYYEYDMPCIWCGKKPVNPDSRLCRDCDEEALVCAGCGLRIQPGPSSWNGTEYLRLEDGETWCPDCATSVYDENLTFRGGAVEHGQDFRFMVPDDKWELFTTFEYSDWYGHMPEDPEAEINRLTAGDDRLFMAGVSRTHQFSSVVAIYVERS